MTVNEFTLLGDKLVKEYDIQDIISFDDYFKQECPEEWYRVVSYAQEEICFLSYITAVNVYLLEDGFVGVRGGYVLFPSEDYSSWKDTIVSIEFYLYEAYPAICYKRMFTN